MKEFTFRGKHYIWRPSILGHNMLKGVCILSVAGLYAWIFITIFTGGPAC